MDEMEKMYIVEKQKIVFTAIGQACGREYLALLFAKSIRDMGGKAAYVDGKGLESGKAMLYYKLSSCKGFNDFSFKDFGEALKNDRPINQINSYFEGINWAIKKEREQDKLSDCELLSIINNIKGSYVVVSSDRPAVIKDANVIVAVIDPLPWKIKGNMKKLEEIKKLELYGHKVIWLVNKYNRGINKKILDKNLKVGRYFKVDFIESETVYNEAFKSSFLAKKCDIFLPEIFEKMG
ncbi:MAG: hypothetical protein MJ145_01420 [Clostridia bacterium]|nr:hypothetical protein [Clostridia bacterium]